MPFQKSFWVNQASHHIYIALGANQSYRRMQPVENLRRALQLLMASGVKVCACSRPWRTLAWPDPSDPPFVNAAVQVWADLPPDELISLFHKIEAELGRRRTVPNAPRCIDLDLIDWCGQIIKPGYEGGLQTPHPRAVQRAFVLLPLRDIAPDWCDPVSGRTLRQLLSAISLADQAACRPVGEALYAAA